MKQILLTLCLATALSTGIFSQDQVLVDSLEIALAMAKDTHKLEPLQELFIEFIYVDHLRAKSYADQYLEIAREHGNKSQIAFGTNLQGVYCNITSDYQKGLEIFEEAIEMYRALGNRERESALLNNMSIANRSMGYLEKALQNQMQSLAIKEEIGVDDEALAASYWNVGNIQGDIKNYSESNAWYRKAYHIYENLNLEHDLTEVEYNIALNYKDMDSIELAMPIFEKALVYYRKRNFWNSIAGSLDNLGTLSKEKGDLDEAEKYYLEALEISLEHGEKSLPGILYRRLANVERERKDYSKALEFAGKALEVSQKTGVRKKMITDYLVLSQVYEGLGQETRALEYYKKYHALNDSVFAEEKVLAMDELEVKYQTEKKEQEIQLLNERAKRSSLMQQALICAVILLVLLLLTLLYGIRQRKRRNKAEREKVKAELEFRKRELSAFALQLAQKNEVLKNIQDDIASIKRSPEEHREIRKINRKIDQNLSDDKNWEQFLERFEAVHQGYQQQVTTQFPQVTSNDLRLMALIKMHLSSKEIANILNLSNEGIKKARYRLRKKLGIETAESLDEFVIALF